MDQVLLLAFLVTAFSVQSAFGFGGALILIPVLSLTTSVAIITPLLAMLGVLLSGGIAWKSRHSIRGDLLWRLLLATALTAPIGIFFVTMVDEAVVKTILGIVIIMAGVTMLIGNDVIRYKRTASPYTFGALAGVLGGAYNTLGPPLVVFFQLRGLDANSYRATLHGFIVSSNIVILMLFWRLDRLDKASFLLLYDLLFPLVLGLIIGRYIFRKTQSRNYESYLCYILLLLGVVMTISSSVPWILEVL